MYYDLVVNLYENLDNFNNVKLKDDRIKIKRILSPDSDDLVDFVSTNFSVKWASEIKSALYKSNPSCFVAVLEGKIIGFACYDATAKGYFGPTGVNEAYRGFNIGQVLLTHTLSKMVDDGYGYAIIGSVGAPVISFYEKYLKLNKVPSKNSVYNRLLYK